MITSQQMRAARALLGIDQRELAERAGLSLPTIQRMEESNGQVRGVVDTLVKVVTAFENAGIEEIGRASCRERACQYGKISGGAGSLQKKKETNTYKET